MAKKTAKIAFISLLMFIILIGSTWWYLKETLNKEFLKSSALINSSLYLKLKKNNIYSIKEKFIPFINIVKELVTEKSVILGIPILTSERKVEMIKDILNKARIFKMRLGYAPDIPEKNIREIINNILNSIKTELLSIHDFAKNRSLNTMFAKLKIFSNLTDKKNRKEKKPEKTITNKITAPEKKIIKKNITDQNNSEEKKSEKINAIKKIKPDEPLITPAKKEKNRDRKAKTPDNKKNETYTIPFSKLKDYVGKKVQIIYKIGRVQKGKLLKVGKNFIDIHVFFNGGNMRMRIYLYIIERVEKVIEKKSFFLEDIRGN